MHALGIQGHLDPRRAVDAAELRAFVREVTDLGLEVLVTELDVNDTSLAADPGLRDQAIAEQYAAFLGAVLAETGTTAVLTWGVSDRYSWLHRWRPRPDGLRSRGLPFDDGLQAKAAREAMRRTFLEAPRRG